MFKEVLGRVLDVFCGTSIASGIALQTKELPPGLACEEVVCGPSHKAVQLVQWSPVRALTALVGGVHGCWRRSNAQDFSSDRVRGQGAGMWSSQGAGVGVGGQGAGKCHGAGT